MTTGGEGGMVTTNDAALWSQMWSYKDHGKSYDAVYHRAHPPGFRWVHESFGTNWRMLEMQAVIGRIQLRRMANWTDQRSAHAAALATALQPFAGPAGAVRLPAFETDSGASVHAQYKFYAFVRPENLAPGWSRDRIVAEINALGVPCYQGTCSEVYLEKAFDGTGFRPVEPFPVARKLGQTSLMWLVHPTLTEAEIAQSCAVTAQVLKEAMV
jgi:dTDP-4-amino-4,6-dideoxygalactose transaminase